MLQSFDEIVSEPIGRISTGINSLDMAYGFSEIDGKKVYGLPKGKISIWAGEGGVGKTRICISLSCFANNTNETVLVFQQEVTPSEYKGWVKQEIKYPKKYYVSREDNLQRQIEQIKEVKPQLVIVDSVNMIEGIETSTREVMTEYRNAVAEVGCHVIFIAHFNKKKEIKGNNDIGYLGDVIAELKKCKDVDKVFYLKIGKNRYGKSDNWVAFKHTEKGIKEYTSFLDFEKDKMTTKEIIKKEVESVCDRCGGNKQYISTVASNIMNGISDSMREKEWVVPCEKCEPKKHQSWVDYVYAPAIEADKRKNRSVWQKWISGDWN